ncbi:hypothetical protein JJB52_14435 [Clostridium perfringens]|uniref:Uncharacterized protein n=1 Tax=Clostridium perfringens F262 TaxID=883064 RepID=A0AAV3FHI4_CLOPF|nr:hypothetical protein [Clostridium perfringens]EIA18732.1 hypothetical protein HA1_00255 [Clostridium perfringens F262]ELC8368175.1 hypothetical protein [Clostridium perfringens]MBO3345041.1 hypothetical protein [Clostridium perfringens]MBO3348130.1 hypothetical protein [Clostridium perfringens]MBO3351183.1 hypothetical protein [Clostridium perfringens]
MAISEEFIDIAENCVDYSARHREAVSSMNSCKSCLNCNEFRSGTCEKEMENKFNILQDMI